jgi:major intracellular serine protease
MVKLWPYLTQDVTPQAERPWNLDQVNAPLIWPKSKGGCGVVAVIDTGVDVSHPEFAGRIFKPLNLTRPGEPVNDTQGHGTHVAGIIAGSSCGVAPDARIMPLQVFGAGDVGLNIQEAFRTVLQHNRTAAEPDKVVVVNCSFGSSAYDPITAYLIRSLVSQGVTVVVSAGNAGDGDPATSEIFSFPAYIWECLTVGAVNRDGQPAGYSNSFDGIDLAAPGTEIYSAWPGGQYKLLSGTSMSAPHVSGAAVNIYDAWRQREGSWPTEEQAVGVLMKHVRKVDADENLVGAGVLDLTWDNKRWPLWHVQTGAFYSKVFADKADAYLKSLDPELKTFMPKY